MRVMFSPLLFVTGIAILLGACEPSACNKMQAIAKDSEKISYLRDWMAENLDDPEVLSRFGQAGQVRFDLTPTVTFIDLDILGLTNSTTFVQINRSPQERENFMDSGNIRSMTLGHGRAGVVISNRNATDLALFWPEESRLNKVAEGVFVYCE